MENCKSTLILIFRGVSINFLAERPRIGVPSPNILFHFNPRPANRLILNSCVNGRWQQEHQVTGNDLDGMLLQTPFDLKIQILTVGGYRKWIRGLHQRCISDNVPKPFSYYKHNVHWVFTKHSYYYATFIA